LPALSLKSAMPGTRFAIISAYGGGVVAEPETLSVAQFRDLQPLSVTPVR